MSYSSGGTDAVSIAKRLRYIYSHIPIGMFSLQSGPIGCFLYIRIYYKIKSIVILRRLL